MTDASLKARITEDMKSALRAKDTPRLGTLRLLLAAIKQREVDERIELDDTAIHAITEKLIKQRRDSISQFQAAGRTDLVNAEQAELAILQTYLPEPMTTAEVEAAIAVAISDACATSLRDMGKVMSLLKPRLAGRADMAQVSALIKARLSG